MVQIVDSSGDRHVDGMLNRLLSLNYIGHSRAQDLMREVRNHGSERFIDHLLESGVNSDAVAKLAAEVMEIPLFRPAEEKGENGKVHKAVEVSTWDSNWVMSKVGVVYMVNPLDNELIDSLNKQMPDVISGWGVISLSAMDRLTTRKEETIELAGTDPASDLNKIMEIAVSHRASDIHVCPGVKDGLIRMRIDGRLHDMIRVSMQKYKHLANAILLRSQKNPGEYIAPVDGQYEFHLKARTINVRMTMAPARVGPNKYPKFTLRLLGLDLDLKDLDSLGLCQTPANNQLKMIKQMARRPHGLILVTGPTGSGKTTTLFAVIRKLMNERPDRSYYTLEDPVEVEAPGVTQIQIDEKAGLTFAEGLVNLMRQDPDVILLGEIRDVETMNMAIRAALTGHLVLSTLHTNSAIDSIPRLIDMGADPTRIADVLVGITAQRVLKRVCPKCAHQVAFGEITKPGHDLLQGRSQEFQERYHNAPSIYGDLLEAPGPNDIVCIEKVGGCDFCEGKGYKGRHMVSEVLYVDRKLQDLIAQKMPKSTLLDYVDHRPGGFHTLWDHAMHLIKNRVTTLDEAESVLDVREVPNPVGA